MEKIAIISDIHGNIAALKTVLEDISKRGITRIFCAGDLVLRGSSPCEVVDIVKQKCEIIVKGNADEGAINGNTLHKIWHREKLGKERLEFLENLPMYYDFYMSGSLIRMFHASKNDTNFRVLDFASVEEKMKLFEDENGISPDIVCNVVENLNHDETIKDMSETLQAYYTILEGEYSSRQRSSLSIQFIRVPYDINQEIEIAKKNNCASLENYILELTTGMYRKNKKGH